MKDPDPFEERHPSRIDSECPFGLILKTFFKKDSLVADIFNNYLRDNYFTRLGQVRQIIQLVETLAVSNSPFYQFLRVNQASISMWQHVGLYLGFYLVWRFKLSQIRKDW